MGKSINKKVFRAYNYQYWSNASSISVNENILCSSSGTNFICFCGILQYLCLEVTVAQLGERGSGTLMVLGSVPTSSAYMELGLSGFVCRNLGGV